VKGRHGNRVADIGRTGDPYGIGLGPRVFLCLTLSLSAGGVVPPMTLGIMQCPYCGEDRQIERTDRQSIYRVRNKPLYVWFCNVCGREFIAGLED
jgi:hypothetical protein